MLFVIKSNNKSNSNIMIFSLNKLTNQSKYLLNYNYIVSIIVFLIIIYIMYSMSKNMRVDSLNNNYIEEGFRNNLKDLVDGGKRKRKEKFNNMQSKKSEISKLYSRLSKTENYYDKNDRSMENFQDKIKKYYNSFNKEKFTNTPPNTRVSLQKFKHFQKAFWDIFKD